MTGILDINEITDRKLLDFRKATRNDAPSLASFVNAAYRGDSSKAGWTTEADLLDGQRTDSEALKQIIDQPNNEIILCFENETLVGSVHLHQESGESLYFGMLTVQPTAQAKGLGKQILSFVEETAKSSGSKQIRILVLNLRLELIAYYERRGFRLSGNSEPFHEDPKYGIPKRGDLRLIEMIKAL